MKRWILAFLIVLAGALVAPAAEALTAPLVPSLSVTVTPRELVPAQAGFVAVSGGYPLRVAVMLDGEPLAVYWTGSEYLAPFAFGFEQPPGAHQLAISAANPVTGEQLEQTETIRVVEYKYPEEYIALAFRLTPLLDPQLNLDELAFLDATYAPQTQPTRWGWPFGVPAPGTVVTSRFGGNRSYNSGEWSAYHTGTDFRLGIGGPVVATTGGRVAAAQMLEVRGKVVIIDHGYGVYSQYAHLSEVYVVPGQLVQRGQVIGLAGATGRTNGPHLHFEIIVNGIPVDPIRWLALYPNFIPPREIDPEREGEGDPADGDVPAPVEGEALPPPDIGADS